MQQKKQSKKQSSEEKLKKEIILGPGEDEAAMRKALDEAGLSHIKLTREKPEKPGKTKTVIFLKKKEPQEPSLDEIIKNNPPSDEDIDMNYEDEDEEEELDLVSPLLPFEENFYDDEGRFYPDGYKDDEGNILGNEPEKEDE